jgi:hypothetical protein
MRVGDKMKDEREIVPLTGPCLFVNAFRWIGGYEGVTLLAVSAIVAAWFTLFGGFVFYGDAPTWFRYAESLVHLQSGNYKFSSGYPILIMLTGWTQTGTVVPLLIVQAVFAALTPWLAFNTFAHHDRWAGLATGVVCLGSLAPFFFQNMLYHDGPSLFFGFLALALASAFFADRRPALIYLSIASATYAYFVQPAMIGFLVGCAGTFALFSLLERRLIKHVVLAIALFAATLAGSTAAQRWALGHASGQLGMRLFFNVYLQGSPIAKFEGWYADAFRADLVRFFGHHTSADLGSYVTSRFLQFGSEGEDIRDDLYTQYDGRPVDLVDRIFAQPNRLYYETLQDIRDMPDGVADSLFVHASLAFIYRHPLTALSYVWYNLIDLSVGEPWACRGSKVFPGCKDFRQISRFWPTFQQVRLAPGVLPDRTYLFLASREPSHGPVANAAEAVWRLVYDNLRAVLLAAMLLGWLASFSGPPGLRWTYTAIVGAYATNMLVFAFLVSPEFRYQMPGISMTAFAAGAGIWAAASSIKGKLPSSARVGRFS